MTRHVELIRDLVGDGAAADEARRLAVLADRLSLVELTIDSAFADALEQRLLSDGFPPNVVELRRYEPSMQRPRLISIPTPAAHPRLRRLVSLSVAAAVVVIAVAGMSRILATGTTKAPSAAAPAQTVDRQDESAEVATPSVDAGEATTTRPAARTSTTTTPTRPAAPEQPAGDGGAEQPEPESAQGCGVSGDRNRGAGLVPLPNPNLGCAGVVGSDTE